MNLSYDFIKTSRHMKAKLDKELNKIGITSMQFAVMNQIARMNNEVTSHFIANELGSDRPTVSGIVNRLYSKNLISKKSAEKDKRSQILSLTESGEKMLLQLRLIADDIGEEIFNEFSSKDMKELKKLLIKINNNLEK